MGTVVVEVGKCTAMLVIAEADDAGCLWYTKHNVAAAVQ